MNRSEKPHYRAVFVSDLHLGAAGCRKQAVTTFFQSFTCDALYLVGDIFDGYVGRRPSRGQVTYSLAPMLACAPDVYYTPGNHDSFLHKLNGSSLGNLHFEEFFIYETLEGQKLLVIHGDQFDRSCREGPGVVVAYVGAWLYEWLTRLNQIMNLARAHSKKPPFTFAAKAKRFVKGVVKKGVTYDVELLDLARQKGCDGVVCGHVHKPELRNVGDQIYINTGDWVENQSVVLEYETGTIELACGQTAIDLAAERALTPA